MKIICAENDREVGRYAAKYIAEVIRERPNALLGLATGSTPMTTYSELVRMYREGEISFAGARTVNLDEYVGLSPEHSQSYARFMRENLFDHIDIRAENCHIPGGLAKDPIAECKAYDDLLDRLGRVDIQLLGIGHNGHIAFNEPGEHFTKDTTLVELTESTVSANSRFFNSRDLVPTRAISMGIGRILKARKILLLAIGQSKAEILARALLGDVTPSVPASILQFYQGELTVIADRKALSRILEK